MAALVGFFPISTNAYQVNLTGFQTNGTSSGEIYGYINADASTAAPLFCLEHDVTVVVPGQYYAYNTALTGDYLEAAWLMDTYTPTVHGAYTGYTFLQTGIALQNAVWAVIGQPMDYASGSIYDLAMYMTSQVPTSDLSYLSASYARMNLFAFPDYTRPRQDLITGTVPIPAAFWLLGTGLVGLAVLRRKRNG